MIINTFDNLAKYSKLYKGFDEVIDLFNSQGFERFGEGRTEISENLYVVSLSSEQENSFDGVLEIHHDWIDIHCTIHGKDRIAFKEKSTCTNISKEYSQEQDYQLYKENKCDFVDLPENYFCILDVDMAHMAMVGEGTLKKIVIKLKK